MSPTRRTCRATLTVAIVLTLLAVVGVSAPQEGTPSSRQILDRMAAAYSGFTSYRDEGKVLSSLGEASFVTAFERPSMFRFEHSSVVGRPQLYVIWRSASGEAHSWWTLRPETRDQTMSLSIAAAAGVSSTSSHNIPRLLMPDETTGFSFALDDWVDSPVTEEAVDNRACYKLSGHYPYSPTIPVSLWVDKETYVVRKVVSNNSTLLYSPQVNVEIQPSIFQFKPPVVSLPPQ